MERRKTKNIALRELVNALRGFVEARDCLWSFGLTDRLFGRGNRRESLRRYDDSLRLLTVAIEELIIVSRGKSDSSDKDETQIVRLTHDELRMLLGEPFQDRRAVQRGKWLRRSPRETPRNAG